MLQDLSSPRPACPHLPARTPLYLSTPGHHTSLSSPPPSRRRCLARLDSSEPAAGRGRLHRPLAQGGAASPPAAAQALAAPRRGCRGEPPPLGRDAGWLRRGGQVLHARKDRPRVRQRRRCVSTAGGQEAEGRALLTREHASRRAARPDHLPVQPRAAPPHQGQVQGVPDLRPRLPHRRRVGGSDARAARPAPPPRPPPRPRTAPLHTALL